jgi:hypothetical protein
MGAGFSDPQARALAAETGRETGFAQRYLYGTHSDPANRATNFGLMSFQGPRRASILDYLQQQGRVNEQGQVLPGPETLLAQAKFIRNEIETNPEYARTKQQFLANPNIDPEAAAEVLGRNYIRWRYDDPKYASHHQTRRSYLAQIPQDASSMSPISPSPVSGAATTPAAAPAGPVYSRDLGTSFQRLGNFLAPDWVEAPKALTEEQAAQQQIQARKDAAEMGQIGDAAKAFAAMQAMGARQEALANQPMSLLQPMITRGQFRPIPPMRGLL